MTEHTTTTGVQRGDRFVSVCVLLVADTSCDDDIVDDVRAIWSMPRYIPALYRTGSVPNRKIDLNLSAN